MKTYRFNPKAGHIPEGSLEGLIQSLDAPPPPPQGEGFIKRAFKKFGLSQMHMSHLVIDDRTIYLRGKAETAKDRDQMILTAGNVAGVAAVEAEIQVPAGTPEPHFIEIKTSNTLDEVAEKLPGDITGDDLLNANAPLIKSKEDIYHGQTIRVPTEHE
ncbi:peptidoglycan-binding protein LysM [Swingsia samuiensis]|uniref:Peptidoglycan-binding protein LysM n=1 Tax=Swingsia samuiensis TaxID=1293412 RepID=A0A4Y6UIV4_9PROT|nr:peptidoglycan-binding protein LysM [Swingsia samuiensis]QDH17492.1 peptidoglycan-binding protein LysM [Swingsia samuiensis]